MENYRRQGPRLVSSLRSDKRFIVDQSIPSIVSNSKPRTSLNSALLRQGLHPSVSVIYEEGKGGQRVVLTTITRKKRLLSPGCGGRKHYPPLAHDAVDGVLLQLPVPWEAHDINHVYDDEHYPAQTSFIRRQQVTDRHSLPPSVH